MNNKPRFKLPSFNISTSTKSKINTAMSCLLVSLLIVVNSASAQWLSARGEAEIIDGNYLEAKNKATKEAVKQALLSAGASVSSLQQIQNGVITQDLFEVRSDGEIRQIITNSEQIEGNKVIISLQVDVVSAMDQCQFSKYAKSIALARFTLANREQASNGRLFHIGSAFSRRLYKELETMPHLFDTRQWIDAIMPFKPSSLVDPQKSRNKLFALSQSTDSQIIVLGLINDLSMHKQNKRLTKTWFNRVPRNFSVRIFVFDGMTGESLFTKQYQTQAVWDYEETDSVDLSSAAFWQRPYGQAMDNILENIVIDLDDTLKCTQPLARIVAINGEHIQINLGKRNGIAHGDSFKLYHSAGFIDQFGHIRSQLNNAHYEVEVESLYQGNTVLKTLENYPMSNIQLNDIAKLKGK